MIRAPYPGVYLFKLLSPRTCRLLLALTDARKGNAPDAPNTMNRYGLVLRDVGLQRIERELLRTVNSLAACFFPEASNGGRLKQTHGFLVDYEVGKQRSLATHYDDSDVTLNVCLGREFTGGRLAFKDGSRIEVELDHRVGWAVLHHGRHLHQARAVESGRRTNLIVWCSR